MEYSFWHLVSDMAEAACTEDQWEGEAFEDEFGVIIKTRSGKNVLCNSLKGSMHANINLHMCTIMISLLI